MKKKILPAVITLICLSLLGIIGVQFFWIRNAIKVKEEQFNRSVNDAMTDALAKLETREDIMYLKQTKFGDSIQSLVQAFSNDPVLDLNEKLDSLLDKEELIPRDFSDRFSHEERFLPGNELSIIPGYEYYEFTNPNGNGYSLELNIDIKKVDSVFREMRENQLRESERAMKEVERLNRTFDYQKFSTPQFPGKPHPFPEPPPDPEKFRSDMKRISSKAKKIKEVIRNMAIELETKPLTLTERIDTANIGSVLSSSLHEKGIDIPFEYAVSDSSNRKILHSKGFSDKEPSALHKATLFPNDIFRKKDFLLLYFPDQKKNTLGSASKMVAASVFFTLIIVITSVLSIIIMLRQKKISEIKTDFINNMTHEFKTPIATISIAVDSITNPKVIDDPERIRSLTRVIKEENNRMNTRVEQVLQMALLDSSEFRINSRAVDIHTVLYKVTDHFRLQIEKRHGTLEFIPEAAESVVRGDDAHLTSVFLNLIDNANKYSTERPEITVATKNEEDKIIISVTDKGIGMSPEVRNRIFEKFYRVTSGNIHNVKGFGLGLSYVKAIVQAHKGDIKVSSEPGKGSCFMIELPTV